MKNKKTKKSLMTIILLIGLSMLNRAAFPQKYADQQSNAEGAVLNSRSEKEVVNVKDENNVNSLISEHEKEFNKRRLSVKLTDVGTSSYDHIIDLSAYANDTNWQAYRGSRKISKEEFLKIAGLKEIANEIKINNSKNDKLKIFGALSMLAGIGILHSEYTKKNSPYSDLSAVGWALSFGGLYSVAIGIEESGSKSINYATAKSIAKRYNKSIFK